MKKKTLLTCLLVTGCALFAVSCEKASEPAPQPSTPEETTVNSADENVTPNPAPPAKEAAAEGDAKTEIATLGGGCFWCTEAVYERVEGVTDVISGYMGGHVENPTYEQVCGKKTGHIEVIQVHFDPAKITYDEILEIFWQAHDPTTKDRQGADRGPQYRSAIFYHDDVQKAAAEASMKKLDESGYYDDPAVTVMHEVVKFWPAEDYHQDYFRLNGKTNGYCQVVIHPKLKKLEKAGKIKKESE